jgi:heme-degrading monooxygenase HmoA
MAVTEIAVLHAKAGTVTAELKQRLAEATRLQEKWLAKNFPYSPPSDVERGTAMFQQVEEPAKFLITARWDSVAAHRQWINSEENKGTMDGIRDQIAMGGESHIVLRHVEGELFAGPAPEGITHMLEAPVVSVGRTYVPAQNKAAADAKIKEIAGALREFAAPRDTRWGWAEDPEDETKLEFIIVAGWDSIEAHLAFKKHPSFAKWQEFVDLADSTGFLHYKRFL